MMLRLEGSGRPQLLPQRIDATRSPLDLGRV